jgi:hypothetical protein
MPPRDTPFEFVVENTERGWMILSESQPMGPFFSKEHAVDLAEGMAAAMRRMGDQVVVRVKVTPPRHA